MSDEDEDILDRLKERLLFPASAFSESTDELLLKAAFKEIEGLRRLCRMVAQKIIDGPPTIIEEHGRDRAS
jgi:hypothetical protein